MVTSADAVRDVCFCSGAAAAARSGTNAAADTVLPVDPGALQQLLAMGFSEAHASRALQLTHNDVNAAIALLV